MYFENEDVCVYYTCYMFNGVVHICNLKFFLLLRWLGKKLQMIFLCKWPLRQILSYKIDNASPPTFYLQKYFENEEVRVRLDLLYYLMTIKNMLYICLMGLLTCTI